MIRRGTTPTHTITIPYDRVLVKDVRLSYAQDGNEVIVKSIDDFSIEGQEYSVTLTQDETFSLEEGTVEIQYRVLFGNGTVASTDAITRSVYKSLNEEVLQ